LCANIETEGKEKAMKREFDPLEEKISEVMRRIGDSIHVSIIETAPNYGFALFVFEFGADGRVNFVSDANRASLLGLMKDLVAQWEREANRPPPPRR
jgi:predicted TIM-barrel fold metal-dependent hydrolase